MTNKINTFTDISAIAQAVQEDADFILRETAFVPRLIKGYNDMSGGNERTRYDYNEVSVVEIGESDDLSSQGFAPSAGETLTPIEDGAQFLITDERAASDAPENIMSDAAEELGFGMSDKLSQNIYGLFSSLTGGTVGAAGSTMTWAYVFAAITRARVAVKNKAIPLSLVMHEYQWHAIANTASIAGASIAQAPQFTDEVTRKWYVGQVAGVPIFTSPDMPVNTSDDCYAAVFAKQAMAYDLRKAIGVEPERDASRRAWELNGTHSYAYGVWRPTFGVQIISDCQAPS